MAKQHLALALVLALHFVLGLSVALASPLSPAAVPLARARRAATARQDRLWDEAVIPYEIDPVFGDERAQLFRAAMRHWENYTCVKFVERQPDEHRNFIVFTERSCGCCSFVGKRGNGAQAISIGKHCDKFGIVVHELGHVVGFWHEHTRPDRDQHVQIIARNIMQGQEYNFNKLTRDEVNSLGLAYDYDSILHYATNTFARDTYLDTILPLHGPLNTEEAGATLPSAASITTTTTAAPSTGAASANSSSTATFTSTLTPTTTAATTTTTTTMIPPGRQAGMINDEEATAAAAKRRYARLQADLQSMVQFQQGQQLHPAGGARNSRGQDGSQALVLIDGGLVPVSTTTTTTATRRKRDDGEAASSTRWDVDDGLHMLAMDNLLAKTRPEIGQRVRLSVGDIAQTNLLYKCPKCGRTIQQTSGHFHSPNYHSNKGKNNDDPETRQARDTSNGDLCEWRLTVGLGERIMINITDLDMAPPLQATPAAAANSKHSRRLGSPRGALTNEQQYDTYGSEPMMTTTGLMLMENCSQDYLEVRDGYTYRAPLIAKLCGHISALRDSLRPIVSTGNRLLVTQKIGPSSSPGKRGFMAQHETICGGYIMLGNYPPPNEPPLAHVPFGNTQNPTPPPPPPSPTSPSINALKTTTEPAATTTTTMPIDGRLIINSSSENEVPLSAQTNPLRYNHLQSQQPMPFNPPNPIATAATSDITTTTTTQQPSTNEKPTKAQFGWSQWPPINTSIIQSPNWPEHYRASKECIWQVRADENHQISLRFDMFDLESHDSCAYDYVEVRDGDSMNSELIGRFCGNRIPEQILSSTPTLTMKFVSDSDVNRAGFLAFAQAELDECKLGTHGCSYKCSNSVVPYKCECPNGLELAPDGKNCIPTCGGVRNESFGQITSPSFPDLYPISTKCVWEIIAPAHHRITLNFSHFDLEGIKAQECDYDYVDIRSKLEDGKYAKNGVYCGPNQNLVVTSLANIMRIEFNSDNSIQKSGFMAKYFIDKDECAFNNGGCLHVCTNTIGSYKCSCNNGFILDENKHDCLEGYCTYTISAPEGSFHSPNFPNTYQPNKECAWVFNTSPGHRIKLMFDQFDLESHQECAYDHVAVYDGESTDDPALGRFCGARRPLTLVSSFNMMYLLFRSDATNEKRGFNATHSTVCGGRLLANVNQNDLIHSHSRFDGNTLYNRNEDCEWLIEANFNQRVRIEFTFFALESDIDCNYDHVIVYDGPDDAATQLARLCGTDILKKNSRITSSGESMVIVFKSDDSINNKGFSLTYTAVEIGDDEMVAITNPTGKQSSAAP